MDEITVAVKMKDFKLKVFINLIKIVGIFSENLSNRLFYWMFMNLDKFYTIEV